MSARVSPASWLALAALAACACGPVAYHLTPSAPPAWVRFEPPAEVREPMSITVTPVGMGPFTCITPCSLLLPAGTYGARFDMAHRVSPFTATVPSGESRARIRMRRNGLYLTGTLLDVVGGAFVTAGGTVLTVGGAIAAIALSATGITFLIPGSIMVGVAGSDGAEFSPAARGTFSSRDRSGDPRLLPSRAERDLTPAVPYTTWSF